MGGNRENQVEEQYKKNVWYFVLYEKVQHKQIVKYKICGRYISTRTSTTTLVPVLFGSKTVIENSLSG